MCISYKSTTKQLLFSSTNGTHVTHEMLVCSDPVGNKLMSLNNLVLHFFWDLSVTRQYWKFERGNTYEILVLKIVYHEHYLDGNKKKNCKHLIRSQFF